jgi:hypothetical protein
MNNNYNYKFLFSTNQVISIQSKFYYPKQTNLGFTTLANSSSEYAEAVFNYIYQILSIKQKQEVDILELGPGTLFFAKIIINLFAKTKFKVNYTCVDINPNLVSVCNELGINLIISSFDNFSRLNKKNYDFLILNQALDMWAGNNICAFNNQVKHSIKWRLYDVKSNKFISKTQLQTYLTVKNEKYLFWIKYYKSQYNIYSSLNHNKALQEQIFLPYSLFILIQKVKLGGIFQDYWNIDNSGLRIGLTGDQCYELEKLFENNKQIDLVKKSRSEIRINTNLLSITKKEPSELINWFSFNIIPFGSCDITYSPEISRVISLLDKSGFKYQVLTLERMISKLCKKLNPIPLNDSEYGIEKNILLFEKKNLLGKHINLTNN